MTGELRVIDGGARSVAARGTWWTVNLLVMDQERVLRGWTRGELARQAHVDPGTVSDMFRGRRRPVLSTVQALSTALGLALSDVIEFDVPLGRSPVVRVEVKESA
jgi:transcriptional regulator with XRE-family HTH domain